MIFTLAALAAITAPDHVTLQARDPAQILLAKRKRRGSRSRDIATVGAILIFTTSDGQQHQCQVTELDTGQLVCVPIPPR